MGWDVFLAFGFVHTEWKRGKSMGWMDVRCNVPCMRTIWDMALHGMAWHSNDSMC